MEKSNYMKIWAQNKSTLNQTILRIWRNNKLIECLDEPDASIQEETYRKTLKTKPKQFSL